MRSPLRRHSGVVPGRLLRLLPSDLRADLRHRTGFAVPGDLAFRSRPPTPAVGERTGPPDFTVAGAAEAGSEWWYSAIVDRHDAAPVAASAELSQFFSPYCTERFGPSEVATFRASFTRRPGQLAGLWSPQVAAHPWVPALLAMAAPRTRLVVLVRDPIERLLAGLDRTVAARPPHPGSYYSDAVDRSRYAQQLGWILRVFAAEQVLVLQTERCLADPQGQMARVSEFLGTDPPAAAPAVGAGPTWPPAARGRLDPATLERLRKLYAPDVADLGVLVPDLDLSWWPNFAEPA